MRLLHRTLSALSFRRHLTFYHHRSRKALHSWYSHPVYVRSSNNVPIELLFSGMTTTSSTVSSSAAAAFAFGGGDGDDGATRRASHNNNNNNNKDDDVEYDHVEKTRERKRDLRKKVRGDLRRLSADEIQDQSRRVWERLFALSAYARAKSVGLFLSMPSGEIDTDPALRRAVRDGKILYVPRVGLDFEKCDMDMISVSSSAASSASSETDEPMFYETWSRNKWGIPEPPTTTTDNATDESERAAAPGDIDLLVVPGVAFDSTGARLGQGKGYYDRFISRIRTVVATKDGNDDERTVKPTLVAVGLTPQFLDRKNGTVPTSEHDFQMDVVLTPEATHIIRG